MLPAMKACNFIFYNNRPTSIIIYIIVRVRGRYQRVWLFGDGCLG